jgi:hypothetical protein
MADQCAPEQTGPGFASPQLAAQAPPEDFIYVACLYEGTGIDRPDFIAVVDVNRESDAFGQIIHRTEMPNVDRRPDGSYAVDPDFFVDFHDQADGARPHEIHLPGGDCTTEIFQ